MSRDPRRRVVSLVPGVSEMLALVGAEDSLVGRSHECDWPPTIRDRPVVTRSKQLATTSARIDAEVRASSEAGAGHGRPGSASQGLISIEHDLLRSLRPDVIFAQDLCPVCAIDPEVVRDAAARLEPAPAVMPFAPAGIEDMFDDVLRVGEAVGAERGAHEAIIALRDGYWSAVDYVNPYASGPEVLFVEWMEPVFVAGHWTPAMIAAAGGTSSLSAPGDRSRVVAPEEIVASQPEYVVVSPCGYSLDAISRETEAITSQRWWNALPAVAASRVVAVDGNQMFSRPGPRLVDAFRWLVGWINDRPELVPPEFPVARFGR